MRHTEHVFCAPGAFVAAEVEGKFAGKGFFFWIVEAGGNMKEGLKVFVVACEKCGDKQIWDADRVAHPCDSCETLLVKKTISDADLKQVKSYPDSASIAFSNYNVYSVYPEDVEKMYLEKRAVKKAEFDKKREAILSKRKLIARG